MRKGERTKASILKKALQIANREGLRGLTIGGLASCMGMSKSGVFMHFGSHEGLLVEVLAAHHAEFTERILVKCLHEMPGLPRLRAIVGTWAEHINCTSAVGALYLKAALEYDFESGEVRRHLRRIVTEWQEILTRCVRQACEAEQLQGVDPEQFVFELYGLMYAILHEARFLKRPDAVACGMQSFDRLLRNYFGGLVHEAEGAHASYAQ